MFGKTIDHTIARWRTTGDKLAFVGPTLARLTVGLVFIGTGWGKQHSLSDVTEFFTTLHIPAPAFNARLTAATEFFGGLAVLLGLGTRLVSLPYGGRHRDCQARRHHRTYQPGRLRGVELPGPLPLARARRGRPAVTRPSHLLVSQAPDRAAQSPQAAAPIPELRLTDLHHRERFGPSPYLPR